MDVGDAEEAGDDGVGLSVGELLGDDVFGDAVEDDDEGGDAEHEGALVFGFGFDCGSCDFVGCGHQACGSVVAV